MTKKKSVAKKVVNKNARKKGDKVRADECPNNVCPIDKKKKKCCDSKGSENLWGQFLSFVFPSRKR